MNRGFMGSGVFGNRVGAQVPIRGFVYPKKNYALGQGVSRTEGVAPEPAAPSICGLIKTALDASSEMMIGPEWNLVFSALDEIRPQGTNVEQWLANLFNKLALLCPDEVARLRSLVTRRSQ